MVAQVGKLIAADRTLIVFPRACVLSLPSPMRRSYSQGTEYELCTPVIRLQMAYAKMRAP